VESVARLADFTGARPLWRETPMKRNVNNISEVKLNFMDFRCIGKSIERFLRCGFEIFDNTDYLVNSRLVDQTARPINEQANV
jgi:hypothetical protein